MYRIADISFETTDIYFKELEHFQCNGKYIKDDPFFYIDNKIIDYSPLVFDSYYFIQPFNSLMTYNKSIMVYDKELRHVHVISENSGDLWMLFLQFFYMCAIRRKMICIHSSLIEYKGHGLMFLGPSGIGKTTQAELWNKYRSATIINGDIVFVQEKDNLFIGWGTPWHGSSVYCKNESVPVKALVVLKQSAENIIYKLSGLRKLEAVLKSVFYPKGMDGSTELCMEILDHMLKEIPVYELACRPDKEAVEVVEEMIFK